MSKRDINRFVESKEKWIRARLAKSRQQAAKREAFTLDYGDKVLYRGREYPIAAREGKRAGFDGTAFLLPPNLAPEQIKAGCVKIYRALAKHDLDARTLAFAGLMGTRPSAVRINSAKTRWGSCSANKNINFSWRLIMADDDVIDYVIVHELAHLAEMNHSPRFWAVVERVLPDFSVRRKRLHELQKRLAAENWEKRDG